MSVKYFGILLAALYLTFGIAGDHSCHADVSYKTIALSGTQAYGMDEGIQFSDLFQFRLHPTGEISFQAFVTGPGVDTTNRSGVWLGSEDTQELILRSGDCAPGTEEGVVYNSFGDVRVYETGQVSFISSLAGPGITWSSINRRGLWIGEPGSYEMLLRYGSPVPDAEVGVYFDRISICNVTDGGMVIIEGYFGGEGINNDNEHGLWSIEHGTVETLLREGDQAPGVEAGVTTYDISILGVTKKGQIAFTGHLKGTGIDSSNRNAIWVGTPDNYDLLVRSGDPAPAAGDGMIISGMRYGEFNDAGQVSFLGDVYDEGTVDGYSTAFLVITADSLELVALGDERAPGVEPTTNFGKYGLDDQIYINKAGQVVFRAFFDDGRGGVWAGAPGDLDLVALSGMQAPSTELGVRFKGDFPLSGFTRPVMNGAGQVLIGSELEGPGVDLSNDNGLWATDKNGELKLICRKGDQIDVNDDPSIVDLRTIKTTQIGFIDTNGVEGYPTSFNDQGQIALRLEFTDGSHGLFLVTIPEPGMFGLMAGGAALLVRRRGK